MRELLQRSLALLREGTLPVMLPLILCAGGICFLIVERALYLFGTRSFLSWFWPPFKKRVQALRSRIAESLEEYIRWPSAGHRDTILYLCRKHKTPYTSFISSIVAEDAFTMPSLKDLHLAEARLRQELLIIRGLSLLSMLAKLAPLLGLFGTVSGMIQTFRVMMLASTSDPRSLSAGISIALIATEVGLAVALPGVIGSSWLHRRAQTLIEEIHLVCMRIHQGGALARPEAAE